MAKFSWGKLAAKVSGLKDWREHDASRTWADAGEAARLFDKMLPEVQSIIANNVKEGVAEYAASGEYTLSVREGALWVDLRIWNDDATLVVGIPIRDLLNKGIAEAYPNIAANPEAQEFFSLIASLGRDIAKITQVSPAGPGHNSRAQGNVGANMAGRIARKETA